MNRFDNVGRVLFDLNPVRDQPAASDVPDAAAQAQLRRILNSPPEQSKVANLRLWRPRATLLATVAAVVLALVAGLQLLGSRGQSAMAATPPPLSALQPPTTSGASKALQAIAARIEDAPDDTGTGDVAIVRTRSWSLFTRVDDESVTSVVVPATTSQEITPDGTTHVDRTFEWPNGDIRHEEFTTEAQPMWPLRSLSADDATLANQLERAHPTQIGPVERLVAVRDAYLQMPLPPATRAAILRYLAKTPGIASVGSMEDRVGRIGVGFTLDSDASGLPTRYTVIIDPQTGELLDMEEMLTKTAGELNVPVPSVIDYTVWLDSSYSDSSESVT